MKISFSSYRREGVVNSLTERGKRANSEPNKWKTQRNLSGQKLLLPETLHVTLNSHSGRVGGCKQGAAGDNSFSYTINTRRGVDEIIIVMVGGRDGDDEM